MPWSGTGSGRRQMRRALRAWRRIGIPRWRNWPEGTWPATARPPIVTLPSGPGYRCATRAGGLVQLAGREPAAALPPPRLLGSFDPVLHGWASREPILGAHQGIVTVN